MQDLQPELANIRQELEACKEELKASQATAKSAQAGLEEARAELEKQRRSASREESADAERRQWLEDVVGATKGQNQSQNQSRPASPFFPIARTFSTEFNGLPLPGSRPRRAPTPGSIPDAAAEVMSVGMGRRLSAQPPMRSGTGSTGFNPPPSPFLPFEAQSEGPAPSPSILEREQGGEEPYLASPRQMAQDMISVSTVAAGPSVQLVERMSAAIRRLEAEKVAAKEEMARVYNQRDEARADMVSLMKDLEAAKTAPSRVKELEQEVADLNQRYQTTLEMLGEKSELVEELKADVQDVKAMYRELVERTVK
jgi:TATA element modulatory factor